MGKLEKKPNVLKRGWSQVTTAFNLVVKTAKNLEYLAQAIALLVVSIFAVYAAKKLNLPVYGYYVVIASAAVIGLRGAYEFVKFLNREA